MAALSSVRILGPVDVGAGERAVGLSGRRLTLFAVLVVNAGSAVSSDTLIDVLWPDAGAGAGARKRLQMTVTRLRQALEPLAGAGDVRLRTVGGGYLLALGPDDLDAAVFARHVASGLQASRTGDWVQTRRELAEGLALWRGPPLADVAYEDFAQSEIRRLDELRAVALEGRIEADLQLGGRAEVISELEALLTASPTRERLAGQLMRALRAVGRRSDALEVYQRTRRRLSDELGLDPSEELARLQRSMLRPSPAAPEAVTAAPNNLPIAPSLIGRRDDVEGVRATLKKTRLVTLVGTGGVGKTRLAVELAHTMLDEFPDGTWWIDLTALADARLVAAAAANALDVREQTGRPVVETLADRLGARRVLIVIDNCEHLIDACATLVDRLLTSCPRVRVLATSRGPLNVPGECSWHVRPLTVPSAQDLAAGTAVATESVRLFAERGQGVHPGFAVDEDNLGAVAEICRRLDGVALAIELAAARLSTMTVEEIASRLDDRFRLLTGGGRTGLPRQRTLEATVAWSYELLAPAEQLLFDRLAVFAGGFSLPAAQRVCADETLPADEIPDLTGRLVERSMITADRSANGRDRYGMLETLGRFGRRKLAEGVAAPAVRDRHLAWCAEFARTAQGRDELAEEAGNLRTALDWAIDTGAEEAGLQIAARQPGGPFEEYARRYALLLPPSGRVPARLPGEVLLAGGELAFMMGDWPKGAERCAAAVAAAGLAGDGELVSYGKTYHGFCLMGMNRDEEALPLFDEGLAQARATGSVRAEARAMLALTWLHAGREPHRAERTAREALRLTDAVEDVFDRGHLAEALGFVLCLQQRYDEAVDRLADALALAPRVIPGCSAHLLETAAAFAAMTDRLELGAQLLGAATRIRQETGDRPRPWERAVQGQWLPLIAARLPPTLYVAAIERGAALGRLEALGFAEVQLRACGRSTAAVAQAGMSSGPPPSGGTSS